MKTVTILALSFAMLMPFGSHARAQDSEKMQQIDPKTHREFMPVHAKLVEELKGQEAELAPLLAEMNAASGEKRIDALVAVVNKLVEQRRVMQEKMAAGLGR